jgi:sugar lactone lactonase YvrE
MRRRTTVIVLAFVLAALVAALPAAGGKEDDKRPETIALPNGWQPEGIAGGNGSSLYVGSIPTGAVWKGDARKGTGSVLVPPHEGRAAIGIKVDNRRRIFVAGGPTGKAFLYNARNGADIAEYQLAPAGAPQTFVNDVVLTARAAFFTDSRNQQIYKLPLRKRGGLPSQSAVTTIPLTGDIAYILGNNANGIVAASDNVLIVVQSNTGKLFRVNARTGGAREIGLGSANVLNGDGLLLKGRTLYVVQNRDNKIAVVRLGKNLTSGSVLRYLTEPEFDVPTTLARSQGRLYAVNARFGTPPTPDTTYDIVRVEGG